MVAILCRSRSVKFLHIMVIHLSVSNYSINQELYTRFSHVFQYNDVIMGTIASQITSLTIVYSIVYLDADQRKHQSSASLAFVRGIHRGLENVSI